MNKNGITLFHPNSKGTGSLLRVELTPAVDGEHGFVTVGIIPQDSSVDYSTYDIVKELSIDLGPVECTKMIEVLRGVTESIEEGKGIIKREEGGAVVLEMSHVIDPVPGYNIVIKRRASVDAPVERQKFRLTTTEGWMLSIALERAVPAVAFGI